MKRLLILLIMLPAITLGCFPDSVYKVDTSYGEKTVVVPEGLTCEDVMLILAKNYYELSYEHDNSLKELETLSNEVKNYIDENRKLRDSQAQITNDYKELVSKFDSLQRSQNFLLYVKPGVIFTGFIPSGADLSAGTIMGTSFMIEAGISVPFNILSPSSPGNLTWRLGLGFVF